MGEVLYAIAGRGSVAFLLWESVIRSGQTLTPRDTLEGGLEVDTAAPEAHPGEHCDVLIAGAGVAGLAAGLLLARAGLRVVCVDPETFPRRRVGESLDWSAPALLANLGLPAETLVADGLATHKRELRGVTADLQHLVGRPPRWVQRWPLRFVLSTVHVDRPRFDQTLYESARAAGVDFVWDRVDSLRFEDDRVVEGSTRSGRRLSCRWFLDASGRTRILARCAAIGKREYGVSRMALWSQLPVRMEAEATTLYFDEGAEQLSWIWEIPIETNRRSVGIVMPLERFRSVRSAGSRPAEVLTDELSRFPQVGDLPTGTFDKVEARAFHSYVSDRTAGSNWLMIGEAAAFIDPLTSIGVTSALRHASEAAAVICDAYSKPERSSGDLLDYDRRTRRIADFYNTAINTLLYSPILRTRLGLRWAGRAYVVPGYVTNSLYARMRRPNRTGTRAILALLGAFGLWTRAWATAARLADGHIGRRSVPPVPDEH